MLRASAAFLKEHAGPQDPITVFPYQTRYGLAARRDVAGGMLQPYISTGEHLSRREIGGRSGLRHEPDFYFRMLTLANLRIRSAPAGSIAT